VEQIDKNVEIFTMCKAMLDDEMNLYHNYTATPYALETLKLLKENGIKLATCSNSNSPLKNRKLLRDHGFEESMFDAIIISADVGVRKPNPDILKILKE
jgi:FMN phosphatase YigB (HAD superfamily)